MLSEQTDPATRAVAIEPLTESEAAARLGLKIATLRAWRHQGKGPAFLRLGRAIRYLQTDLDEFVQANRHQPTPDAVD
jgi:excisionase family DNA binding protein